VLDLLTPTVVAEITGLGKTVLLLVAGSFIGWSLYTAMVMPKKSPSFPRDVGTYIVATAVLFIAQMSAVVWVTGTQEVEHEAAAGEHTTTGGETQPTETTPETGGSAEGDAAAGKTVFTSAGCVSCHTLADAGASGSVGPNLDQAKPSRELVVERVTNGSGVMPPFKDQLSSTQIADVAAYVSSVAGS
jgi:mono/diheme cytochrome c family protein